MNRIKPLSMITLLLGVVLVIGFSGTPAITASVTPVEVPEEWADTYTPEEYGAITRALRAGNMTLEDLEFRKDYTKGHKCFPWVRDVMADPLAIAPGVDGMVSSIEELRETFNSPYAELQTAGEFYGGFNESGQIMSLDDARIRYLDDYKRELLSPGEIVDLFTGNLYQPEFNETEREDLELLREFLPESMAWHDVFEPTCDSETKARWEELIEDEANEFLYELTYDTLDNSEIFKALLTLPDARELAELIPRSAFPKRRPVIMETELGRIGIGTYRDDEWEGDFAVLIDPGGNDHYINCRIGGAYGTEGSRMGYFADFEGDDFYDCGDVNITLGAAVLGVAAFYDLGQGDDRYIAGSCTLGAAMGGIAIFYDDGGSDTYEGKTFTQGAAGFGVGIMVDDSVQDAQDVPMDEETPDPVDIGAFDNDRYHAWTNSQAFARTLGFAICSNRRGNEIYEAGGVYLHAPLFKDRYQSFSQGFAIGERGIDYAGGIALILDYDGNDRYLGDVYNQGVGYWYSAGLVYDGGGNDTYEMTQYGQGSGIHLAIGALIDVSGNDSYTMHNGLGTGGSHDYAASILHDRGGNDQYFGNTSCNGGSLTNSAVLFIDRSGNDTYAGRRDSGLNFGRPARGFISIGVMVDLDGNDDYLGIMDNDVLWTHTSLGMGWDTSPPPPPETEETTKTPASGEPDDIKYPEIVFYEGELNRETFDELWEIATRWRVGENRWIVPKAVDRLIAFGPDILPYISEEFDTMRSGLALYAFNPILKSFLEGKDRVLAIEVVKENLISGDETRQRVALAIITEQIIEDLESDVLEVLDTGTPEMVRRAIGTLGKIGGQTTIDKISPLIGPDNEEALIKVCVETLFALDGVEFGAIRPLLAHPTITVRETLVNRLVANIDEFESKLRLDLRVGSILSDASEDDIRRMRSIFRVYQLSDFFPDTETVELVSTFLDHPDWAMRGDAVKIVRHWEDGLNALLEMEEVPEDMAEFDLDEAQEILAPILAEVELLLETEEDPYVLFVGG